MEVELEYAGILGVPVVTVGPGLSVEVEEVPGAAMEVEAGGTVGSTINGGWDPQAASVKPKVRATTTDHITTNVRLLAPSQGMIIGSVKPLRWRQGV